jgi:hypothetical protein
MTSNPSIVSNRELVSSQQRIVALIIVAIIVLGAAFLYGRNLRATAERNTATAIEEENRAFCTGLGIAQETEAYVRCADGLANVRRTHEGRLNAEAMGIF